MKSNRALILIIILSGLISALSGIVGNLASNAIPDCMKPLLHYIWPIFLVLMLVSIGLAVWQFLHQGTSSQETTHPLHLSPALAAQNRQRLLAKVRSFWIKGVLENSLHGAALLELGLREQPDAVAHPWQLVLQETDQSTRSLPQGTRITHVYDESIGELLILGEPGSGKTTLLLELARDLLDRAEKDVSLPMPLVFNLSSWATRQLPLAEWLVDEMNTKYQVPRYLGQAWIAADQVLPLLDGLDEVKKEYRPACVGAINTFRLQHGLVPMVVCSRKAEYLDLTTRVLLRTAVVVQLLSKQQIDEYLSNAGQPLESVRVSLREDKALQELVTTPLMLSVLTLVYAGKRVEELVITGTAEIRRRHLFETYVRRMLQRRGGQIHYTQEQTTCWLAWLARQLMRQNQTEFYLERMQPEWLPKSRQHRKHRIVSNLLVGLVGGLLSGLVVGLVGGLLGGLVYGLVVGLVYGLVYVLLDKENIVSPNQGIWNSLRNGLVVGLVGGLGVALVVGLLGGLLGGLVGAGLRAGRRAGLRAGRWWICLHPAFCLAVVSPKCGGDSVELRSLPRLCRRSPLAPQSGWWLYLHPSATDGVLRISSPSSIAGEGRANPTHCTRSRQACIPC